MMPNGSRYYMMPSTGLQEDNEAIVHTSPQILTIDMPPVPEASSTDLLLPLSVDEDYMTRTSLDAGAIFDQEFVVPFPDPVSTLNIHGSSRSDQDVQGTCSLPSSSEQMVLRAASSVNPSEIVHEGGVQSLNVSFGGSTFNTPLANNPPRHLFNDPYEYELEKIRIEEENLKKSVAEMTSQLMAELDRKMAEARSEFDRESQEFDAASKAKVMEVEAHMSLVQTASLLANAFVSKCSERSASNDLAAVRAMISQHSSQQQQAVQTNTHINSTAPPRVRPQQEVQANAHMSTSAPPRPSVIAVEDSIPNSSGPVSLVPRRSTTQPSPMSQQTVQAAHTHVNSTAPPPPSVTAVVPQTPNHLRLLARFLRPTTTQPSPISQQAVVQSNTNVNSTALARPSVTTEALPLHSPLSNTPRPGPRPVISNLIPYSSPPVHGAVRGPTPHLVRAQPPHLARGQAPHLVRGPPPHLRRYVSTPASMSAAAGATTHQRSSVQEQEQQQQGKSNDGLVHLSDDD